MLGERRGVGLPMLGERRGVSSPMLGERRGVSPPVLHRQNRRADAARSPRHSL